MTLSENIQVIVYALIGIFLIALAGCTVHRPSVAAPPIPSTVAAPPTPPPVEPIVTESVVEETPQDPDVVKALQKYEKTKKYTDVKTPAVMKYVFQPERIYTLKCPEWGVLTIRLLPGEVLKRVLAGDSVRWMIDDMEMGLGEMTPVIGIRRSPYADPTQMTVITDANIYEFLLIPGGSLGNERTRQITFWDPIAEMRRFKGQVAMEEQRKKKREDTRYPTLSFEHIRAYDVGGDNVVWRPIRVVGDHQHTMVELPAATGTEQPTLSVFQDGIETRMNYRMIPGRNGNGPVIVADQAFTEARLIGEGGVVKISGRGN